jgi:uncharacterized delta-60 repeat protein
MVRTNRSKKLRTRATILACIVACLLVSASALAADGELDPTFGTGGKVATSFDLPDASANAIALQADGKIVAAGWLFNLDGTLGWAVARYNPDGSLDATFDFDGRLRTTFFGFNDVAEAVVIQPDGKILVAGTVEEGLQSRFAIARYLTDGSLDSTFDGDGRAIGAFFGTVASMVLESDAKIVLAGSGFFSGTSGNRDILLVRYHPQGTPDSTFGAGGIVSTDFSGGVDRASTLLRLAGDKLLVVGTTSTMSDGDHIALARYHPNGSPDDAFGVAGKAVGNFRVRGDSTDAEVQPDGKIVVSVPLFNPSAPEGSFSIVRFLPGGLVLDPEFGSDGKAFVPLAGFDEAATAVAIQQDGRIVAAGFRFGKAQYDFALVRLHSNGGLDATFGSSAVVVTDFFGMSDFANDVLIQPDGRVVAAGVGASGPNGNFALARYRAVPVESAPSPCPRSYGFWRTHLQAWPISSLDLGSQHYGTADLFALLHSPAKGDASVILARELIAAKLNLAAGAGSGELEAIVAVADGLLAQFPGRLPYDVSPSSGVGRELVRVAGRLASATNSGSREGCSDVKGPK